MMNSFDGTRNMKVVNNITKIRAIIWFYYITK